MTTGPATPGAEGTRAPARRSGRARRVAAGALAAACIASTTAFGLPATSAFGKCAQDWSCVYMDHGEAQGIWGTNNPEYDVDLSDGDGNLNDLANSAVNNRDGYMGLYRDPDFRGLMICLGPYQRTYNLQPAGSLTSLRHHADRTAACGAPKVQQPPKNKPQPPKNDDEGDREKPKNDGGNKDQDTGGNKDDGLFKEKPGGGAGAPPLPSASVESPVPAPGASGQLLPEVLPAPDVLPAPSNVAAREPVPQDDGIAGPVLAGIAGVAGIALLTGGILAGLAVRRRYRRGAFTVDPVAVSRVDRGMRLLAVDCRQEDRQVPVVRTVTVDDEVLTARLTTPDGDPPQPWRASRDGTRWILPVSDITELTEGLDEARPFPLLVAVRPGTWLNLLTVPGPISLDGSRRAARRAALTLSRRLRESPWTEDVRIRMVGFPDVPPPADLLEAAEEERGRVVFIDEGREVPKQLPPGAVVIAVGKVPGMGTTWPVLPGGVLEVTDPAVSSEPAAEPADPPGPDEPAAPSPATAG